MKTFWARVGAARPSRPCRSINDCLLQNDVMQFSYIFCMEHELNELFLITSPQMFGVSTQVTKLISRKRKHQI